MTFSSAHSLNVKSQPARDAEVIHLTSAGIATMLMMKTRRVDEEVLAFGKVVRGIYYFRNA